MQVVHRPGESSLTGKSGTEDELNPTLEVIFSTLVEADNEYEEDREGVATDGVDVLGLAHWWRKEGSLKDGTGWGRRAWRR